MSLLLVLLLMACPSAEPSDEGEGPTDDPTLPSTTATLGVEGGRVSLPDGTAVVIPAGWLPGELAITIRAVEPQATEWDEAGFLRAGTPFVVEPELSSTHALTLEVPTDELPGGHGPEQLLLVASGEGTSDGVGFDEAIVGPIHPALPSLGGGAFAVHGTGPTIFQPLVPPPVSAADANLLLQSNLLEPCSVAIAKYVPPPADIDDLVDVNAWGAFGGGLVNLGLLATPAEQAEFVESADRLVARSCLAAYQSMVQYRDVFDMPWTTPGRLSLSLQWVDVTCEAAGRANGHGVILYWNDKCVSAYSGHDPRSLRDGELRGGWNSEPPTGTPLNEYADVMSGAVAHEVFHWVHYRSDGGMTGRAILNFAPDLLVEGGASAMMEEVFDAGHHPSRDDLVELWSDGLGASSYEGQRLWRWIEWTHGGDRTGHVLARWLRQVRGWATLSDGALEPMEPVMENEFDERMSAWYGAVTFADTVTDFASSDLLLHDYERVDVDGSGTFDRWPDALGVMEDEEGGDGLWSMAELYPNPEHEVPNAPDLLTATPLALPGAYIHPMAGDFGATAISILLTGTEFDPEGTVQVGIAATDANGSPFSDVALRLWRLPLGGDAEVAWSLDAITTDLAAPSTFDLHGFAEIAEHYVLVASSTTDEAEHVKLHLTLLELPGPSAWALSSGAAGLEEIGLDGSGASSPCDDSTDAIPLTASTRSDLVEIPGGVLVAYPHQRTLRAYAPGTCTFLWEFEFDPAGPGPYALETTGQSHEVLVALQDPNDPCAPGAFALFDTNTRSVTAQVTEPWGGLSDVVALDDGDGGLKAFATLPGSESCPGRLSSVDVGALRAAGPTAEQDLIDWHASMGTFPTRIDRTPDRGHAAWINRNGDGDLGVLDATGVLAVYSSDELDEPWAWPADVVLAESGSQLRAYFVYDDQTEVSQPPECPSASTCSGLRWLAFDPVTGEHSVSGERVLPDPNGRRLGLTPDLSRLYIAHGSRPQFNVYDLGEGGFEKFLPAPVPEVPGVEDTIAFAMPK